MGIFLDTSFLLSLVNLEDENFSKAEKFWKAIEGGEFGGAYSSDYVLVELAAVIQARTGNMALSKKVVSALSSSRVVELLMVGQQNFADSLSEYSSQKTKLSVTDCSSIVLMKEHSIEYIASFDSDFDSVKGISRLP